MNVHYDDGLITLIHGDAISVARGLDSGSVQTIVTSPPYFGLRDYGETEQIGAEASVGEYVDRMVALFRELRRVLAGDGTLWLNLGDSYSASPGQRKSTDMAGAKQQTKRGSTGSPSTSIPGLAPKNLIGVPWKVAFALQADGWILRSEIIWAKPNPMPESVTDRPTKSHEHVFLLAKSPRYYFDADAIAEPHTTSQSVKPWRDREYDQSFLPSNMKQDGTKGRPSGVAGYGDAGRNKRDVWTVPTVPFPGSHFAVYPPELIRPCILAGSRRGDTVLDPFSGSGTTGMVATQEGRRYIGIDLNAEYLNLSLRERFQDRVLDLTGGTA